MDSPLSFFRTHWDHEPWRSGVSVAPQFVGTTVGGALPRRRCGETVDGKQQAITGCQKKISEMVGQTCRFAVTTCR